MPRYRRNNDNPTITYEFIVTVKACPHDPSDPFDHYAYEVTTDAGDVTARNIIADLYRDRSDLIAITLQPVCR